MHLSANTSPYTAFPGNCQDVRSMQEKGVRNSIDIADVHVRHSRGYKRRQGEQGKKLPLGKHRRGSKHRQIESI